MMKNVKIKSTNKFSLFQEFDEKFENIKSNFKKRMLTKKLTNIIKNDVQFNKFMKKILNQSMKKITIKNFLSCFDVLQKLFFKRIEKKEKAMKVSNLKMRKIKMLKKIEISKFAQRFYAVEISKTIVFLTEKHVKILLNSEIEICIMTFEILNRCDFAMKSDSKLYVISVTKNKAFFERMCENAKVCLEKIIVRIFIFVNKNENHDLIFEIFYERKIMLSSTYFIDDFCEIIIHSKYDIKRIKF